MAYVALMGSTIDPKRKSLATKLQISKLDIVPLKNYLQAVSRNNLCWAQVKMRKKFFSGNAHCMTSPIEFALRSFTGSGAYQFFKLHASIQVAFLNKSFIKDATSDILCHSFIKIDTLGLNGVYVSITNCAYVHCSYVRNNAVIG
ncbi:hypothetical protein T09_8003 [Trichinella sp. T9]|nr:hypothetical protein T09_8003 [Trichinella sp. T9]